MSNILDYYKPRVKKAWLPVISAPTFNMFRQGPDTDTLLQEASKTKSISIPYEIGKSVTYSPAQVAGLAYGEDLPEVYRKARENLRKYKTPQEVGFSDWKPSRFFNPIRLYSTKDNPDYRGLYSPPWFFSPPYIEISDPRAKGRFTSDTLDERIPGTVFHETTHAYSYPGYRILKYVLDEPFSGPYHFLDVGEIDARLTSLKRNAYKIGIHLDTPEKVEKYINILDIGHSAAKGSLEKNPEANKFLLDLAIQNLRALSEKQNIDDTTLYNHLKSIPRNTADALGILYYLKNHSPQEHRNMLLRALYERATQLVKNNNQQRVVG